MDTLEIFNQEDYEKNIDFRGIFIFKGKTLKVRGNSVVIASGNSEVYASGNSEVNAYNNSIVSAYDNSIVSAYDKSVVRAYDKSVVRASGNSKVYAYRKSVVDAYDDSIVRASGNSKVIAHDKSVVRAYDDSIVNASGNSKILLKNSDIKYKITDNAKFFLLKNKEYDLESFKFLAEKYDENSVVLYKSVNPETNCDFKTGQIEYKINEYVEAPDWIADPEIECGNGLHLCLTPQETQIFNKGKILKCRVNLCDISIYRYNMEKVRCRKVFVMEEYE